MITEDKLKELGFDNLRYNNNFMILKFNNDKERIEYAKESGKFFYCDYFGFVKSLTIQSLSDLETLIRILK